MKRTILLITLFLAVILTGCYESTPKLEENYGPVAFNAEKNQMAFLKGHKIYCAPKPINKFFGDKKNKIKYSQVKLYRYNLQNHELVELHNFETLKGWPSQWKNQLKWKQNYLLLSLQKETGESDHQREKDGFYMYDLNKQKISRIDQSAENFWLAPDKKLMLYLVKKNEKYNLHGYDLNSKLKNILNNNIPRIDNLQWLKDGKAALIYGTAKDSVLKINIDQPDQLQKIKAPDTIDKKQSVSKKESFKQ